ncbi:MAG TPA: c-type cytochrome [Caulobacteraceae bacterium]
MTPDQGCLRFSQKLGTLIALAIVCAAPLSACVRRPAEPRWAKFGGDPSQGAILVGRFSCGACHQIVGVQGADGKVGPPLSTFADRTMIAGVLPNTPENLVRWLRHPQTVVPGNAMPDVGLSDVQARDIAAYLYRDR